MSSNNYLQIQGTLYYRIQYINNINIESLFHGALQFFLYLILILQSQYLKGLTILSSYYQQISFKVINFIIDLIPYRRGSAYVVGIKTIKPPTPMQLFILYTWVQIYITTFIYTINRISRSVYMRFYFSLLLFKDSSYQKDMMKFSYQ